ncbi:hypothetical protein CVT25_008028, partial [Psilocybe cyanescens]
MNTTVASTAVADTPSIESSLSESVELNKFVDAAAAGNSRTLEFSSSNLGKEIDLLLTFEPPKV